MPQAALATLERAVENGAASPATPRLQASALNDIGVALTKERKYGAALAALADLAERKKR
jgi:hypothetical protein